MKSRIVLAYTLGASVFSLMVGGFEVALVLRFRNSIFDVLAFQMVAFTMIFLGFWAAGWWLRKGDARGLFRFGFGMQTLACFSLAILVPTLQNPVFLFPFFFLRGIADGVFAGGRSVVFLHVIEDKHRDGWVLRLQVFAIVLGLVVPPLAGALIGGWGAGNGGGVLPPGYGPLLAVAGLWSLFCLWVAPRLSITPQDTRWQGWGSLLTTRSHRPWLVLLAVGCLSGVTASLAGAVLNVQVLGTEFNLGVFSAWITALSAIFFWMIHRLTRRGPLVRIKWTAVGTAGEVVSRTIYSFWPTLPGLVTKSVVDCFVVPFRGLLGENIVRRQLEHAADHHGLSLAQVLYFQEAFILTMRLVTGLILLVLFGLVTGSVSDLSRILLLVCLPLGLVEFFLLKSMDKAQQTQPPTSSPPV